MRWLNALKYISGADQFRDDKKHLVAIFCSLQREARANGIGARNRGGLALRIIANYSGLLAAHSFFAA